MKGEYFKHKNEISAKITLPGKGISHSKFQAKQDKVSSKGVAIFCLLFIKPQMEKGNKLALAGPCLMWPVKRPTLCLCAGFYRYPIFIWLICSFSFFSTCEVFGIRYCNNYILFEIPLANSILWLFLPTLHFGAKVFVDVWSCRQWNLLKIQLLTKILVT